MNVRELIKALQGVDQESLVVLSKDPEGNWFRPLEDVGVGVYEEHEVYAEEDADLAGPDSVPALVLWP